MKYVDIGDLPQCSYSHECLCLIDDLEEPITTRAPARLSHIDDFYDRRRLRQLRSHVLGCPTCSALLAETRRIRTQQRMMLHHFLIANEAHVPSTTGAIFAAIQRERAQGEENDCEERYAPLEDRMLLSLVTKHTDPSTASPFPLHARFPQHHRIFQSFLTLATVAAVILAAVGLLNRFTNQSSTSSASDLFPQRSGTEANNNGWDSVVIGLSLLSGAGFAAYNFDAANGQTTTLFASTQDIAEVNLEGVSNDGQSLLYDKTSSDQQRTYQIFSTASPSLDLYTLPASQAGNAIWMDSEHVLVQNILGSILELDTRTGLVQQVWSLQTGKLTFYHQPFLYFTDAEQSGLNILSRINLAQASATPQQVAKSALGTRFWLSQDGTTISYVNRESSDQAGVYAVNSDGTHLRLLHPGPGIPIGYADDNVLMLMEQVGTRVEVSKLGIGASQKEQVIFSDAVPHATSFCSPSGLTLVIELCDQNITLEPYGDGLLLHAYYADGSHSLVYDNLIKGTSQKILSLAANVHVQLPGWSKISTKGTAASEPLALCA